MKSTEAKVGAFILVCAAVLAVTVYVITKSSFAGNRHHTSCIFGTPAASSLEQRCCSEEFPLAR